MRFDVIDVSTEIFNVFFVQIKGTISWLQYIQLLSKQHFRLKVTMNFKHLVTIS